MKSFFQVWGIAMMLQASIFAWRSMRRMFKIARGQISMTQMSLDEIKNSRCLDRHMAFGDPMNLIIFGVGSTSELGQFFRRWLIYFPLAWLTNLLSPITWIFALPIALGI